MPERQTTEKLEPSFDPSYINKDRSQGWGSEDTKVDATRMITLCQGSENPQETISTIGWLSASILHDLRNPLGAICTGAELLMDLDSNSTHVKRLAANMFRAAGRMRQLLADLVLLCYKLLKEGGIAGLHGIVEMAWVWSRPRFRRWTISTA